MAKRTCILSGKSLPRDRLIRFVAGPEGHAVVDLAEKLPGRGAWIELSADSLRRADDRNLLDRWIGAGFQDAESDITQIAAMLRSRAIAGSPGESSRSSATAGSGSGPSAPAAWADALFSVGVSARARARMR